MRGEEFEKDVSDQSKPETGGAAAEFRASGGRPRFAENELTDRIIGAAIEVHRHLGPGLLESAYEECLCYELAAAGLRFKRQAASPVDYKALKLSCGYKMDLLVEERVVVELKSIEVSAVSAPPASNQEPI